MINVKYPIVKPVVPSKSKYYSYISDVFERNWLTNNGPLLKEFELRLAEYLKVDNLMLVSNGTLALHLAYKALNVKKEVLTTPFSFAATASSICWEGHTPTFVDINEKSLNIEHSLLNSSCPRTSIVAVHVFGNPCEVEAIEKMAKENGQAVIYDAAHAFGVNVDGKSVLGFGDASTLSFHATKVFHTVEGGAVVFKRKTDLERAKRLINFGLDEKGNILMNYLNIPMSNPFLQKIGFMMCVTRGVDFGGNPQAREKSFNFSKEFMKKTLLN